MTYISNKLAVLRVLFPFSIPIIAKQKTSCFRSFLSVEVVLERELNGEILNSKKMCFFGNL